MLLAVFLLVGSALLGGVMAQPNEDGKHKVIYQRNNPDECINPSGYKISVDNHETVDMQFTDDGKCIERIIKFRSHGAPQLDDEKYKSSKTQTYSKDSEGEEQGPITLSLNSKTCVATSRYTDVIYLTLTQVDSHHTFSYDGTYITSESGYARKYYFPDGWKVTSGPTFYFGPASLPAESDYSVGRASFSWLADQWPHTHINQITVNGDGSTFSVFVLIGDTVPGGHFLGSLECS